MDSDEYADEAAEPDDLPHDDAGEQPDEAGSESDVGEASA